MNLFERHLNMLYTKSFNGLIDNRLKVLVIPGLETATKFKKKYIEKGARNFKKTEGCSLFEWLS